MKKRDIRTLFQEDEVIKPLPENHRKDFLEKLNQQQEKRKFYFLKIAVIALFVGCIGLFFVNQKPSKPIVADSFKKIERQYLQDIDKEWQKFTKQTTDTLLIGKYKRKLKKLDIQYKRLSVQHQKQPQDIFVLEELIKNLQHRLSTLKDIQNHLQTLQQKPKRYETIVL